MNTSLGTIFHSTTFYGAVFHGASFSGDTISEMVHLPNKEDYLRTHLPESLCLKHMSIMENVPGNCSLLELNEDMLWAATYLPQSVPKNGAESGSEPILLALSLIQSHLSYH